MGAHLDKAEDGTFARTAPNFLLHLSALFLTEKVFNKTFQTAQKMYRMHKNLF